MVFAYSIGHTNFIGYRYIASIKKTSISSFNYIYYYQVWNGAKHSYTTCFTKHIASLFLGFSRAKSILAVFLYNFWQVLSLTLLSLTVFCSGPFLMESFLFWLKPAAGCGPLLFLEVQYNYQLVRWLDLIWAASVLYILLFFLKFVNEVCCHFQLQTQ